MEDRIFVNSKPEADYSGDNAINVLNKPGATNVTPIGTDFIYYIIGGVALFYAIYWFYNRKKK